MFQNEIFYCWEDELYEMLGNLFCYRQVEQKSLLKILKSNEEEKKGDIKQKMFILFKCYDFINLR